MEMYLIFVIKNISKILPKKKKLTIFIKECTFCNGNTFTVTDTFLNQYFILIAGGGGVARGVEVFVFFKKRHEDMILKTKTNMRK
jgi:hypothetical protein